MLSIAHHGNYFNLLGISRLLCIKPYIFARRAAILATLIAAASIPTGAKAESPPILSASLGGENLVHLSISSPAFSKKGTTKVVLARSIGGKKFKSIIKIKTQPSQTIEVLDQLASGTATAYYRGRLVGKACSKWSKRIAITLSPENSSNNSTVSPGPSNNSAGPSNTLPPLPSGTFNCPREFVVEMIQTINKARTEFGLNELSEHPLLALSSQNFSIHLAETRILSHDGWYTSMTKFGFKGTAAGQNIGKTFTPSALAIFELWMKSEGHRFNILHPSYSYIGIGCVVDHNGAYWWTQDFGGL